MNYVDPDGLWRRVDLGYEAQEGDTLWGLAVQLFQGQGRKWRDLGYPYDLGSRPLQVGDVIGYQGGLIEYENGVPVAHVSTVVFENNAYHEPEPMPEPPKRPEPAPSKPTASGGVPNSSGSVSSTGGPGNGKPNLGSASSLGNIGSPNTSIIQTAKAGNYSHDKTYDLGNGWRARFDQGKVGNKDHVSVKYKQSEEYIMSVDGAKSHKNKSKPGDPPKKVLKKLKEKTGFDWEKARDNYIKMNAVVSLDDIGAIVLPDDTVLFQQNIYWKEDYDLRIKPQYNPFIPSFMPELPKSAYMIDPKDIGPFVLPLPSAPSSIPMPHMMPVPVFG